MHQLIQKIHDKYEQQFNRLPNNGDYKLPENFWAFIWFFLSQVKWLLLVIGTLAAAEAMMISFTYWFVGQIVEKNQFDFWFLMLGLGFLIGRLLFLQSLRFCENILYIPYFGNLVRRQCFHYTTEQSLAYFQNDFAGRIANKLLQCGPALRDAALSVVVALVFVGTLLVTNVVLMMQIAPLLAAPQILWLGFYSLSLWYFLPKIKHRSKITADSMSTLTGQIVDSFTNILTSKYYARTRFEDERAKGYISEHSYNISFSHYYVTLQGVLISILNTFLVASTLAAGYWIGTNDSDIGLAPLAMALPMVIQTTFWSGWIQREMSGISENLGIVQEGIDALSKPHAIKDKKDAKDLKVDKTNASIEYRHVNFNYDKVSYDGTAPVLSGFSLSIPVGQKVGVVGRSGAGKSTLTSLIVRAYDVAGGEILINGQNIANVTQDSLRRSITVVTQESYLFNRSILENLQYGKADATMDEVVAAAKQSHAHDFILGLEDSYGRKGYDAHVGERGVKLSGGQKQRIGIARAILKDAPILILDEATSALDSESEQAIQDALEGIMEDKTVIAIAHRLSTLRQMDRIIVMDAGQIIEDGTHAQLIRKKDGHYKMLWTMQSGGFLQDD